MLIRCKKTGEEYEITDREIGEKIECPCCGEKFVVDDKILPAKVYAAALIRKSEAIALRDGEESESARLFARSYEENCVDAQCEMAKLLDGRGERELAQFWLANAGKGGVISVNDNTEECERRQQNHISDLLQWDMDCESGELERIQTTWRESMNINCPKCEGGVLVLTRLQGEKVRCPHCEGEFFVKGEGIMTTEERKRFRLQKQMDDEAWGINRIIYGHECDGCIISSLRLVYGVKNCDVYGVGDNVGVTRPWPGVYIDVGFKNGNVDDQQIAQVRELLSGALGYRLRLTDSYNGYGWVAVFFIRKDCPCARNDNVRLEMELREERERQSKRATPSKNGSEALCAAEIERLEYLAYGLNEKSINRFDFQGYLRREYGVTGLHIDTYDTKNLKIVVGAENGFANGNVNALTCDLEKRFGREIVLMKGGQRGCVFQMLGKKSVVQHLGRGTKVDWSRENKTFSEMVVRHGISKFNVEMVNPYCAEISIPMNVNQKTVRNFANGLLGELGLLEYGEIDFHQFGASCGLDMNENTNSYFVILNHHDVIGSKPGERNYKYSVEAIQAGDSEDEGDEDFDSAPGGEMAQVMRVIEYGIKSGAIKSKSGEGYFVLKGEFFDAIKAGRKTTEYRDLSPRNLSKSIGIKTVKLQRGYGHPGQPPEQMRFEVSSVGLLDADDRECDPHNIPDGFIATTIAIHLGKRID